MNIQDFIKAEMVILGLRPALFTDYREVNTCYVEDNDPVFSISFYKKDKKNTSKLKGVAEICRASTNIGALSVLRAADDVKKLPTVTGTYIYYVPFIQRVGIASLAKMIANNGGSFTMAMDTFGAFVATLKMPCLNEPTVGDACKDQESAILSAASRVAFPSRMQKLYNQYSMFQRDQDIVKYFLV